MEEEKGIRMAKFFNNSKEIIFCPVIVLSRALPTRYPSCRQPGPSHSYLKFTA
jgi:hypothetical protein